jgi:hypothetical protein
MAVEVEDDGSGHDWLGGADFGLEFDETVRD